MDSSRPWRVAVGGLWEKVGKLQFNFLLDNGLKPEHFLLDVGCGSLRGGLHFISYLLPSHYYGIDKNSELLNGGKVELEENSLIVKSPVLKIIQNFEFETLNQTFDYALAQSVFTHINASDIKQCLIHMKHVLKCNGRFYATFFEKTVENETITHDAVDGIITTFDCKDPFHYPFSFFENICTQIGLSVKYIGNWNHPRGQKMLLFTHM